MSDDKSLFDVFVIGKYFLCFYGNQYLDYDSQQLLSMKIYLWS